MASVTYSTSLWEDEKYDLYVCIRKREWEEGSFYSASYDLLWEYDNVTEDVKHLIAYTLNDLKDIILNKKLKFSVDTEMWLRKRD